MVGREGLGQVPRSERAVRLESGRVGGAGAPVPIEARGAYLGAERIRRRAAGAKRSQRKNLGRTADARRKAASKATERSGEGAAWLKEDLTGGPLEMARPVRVRGGGR